ncbi:MAG: alanine dehydrogenase, partial [Planctomycetota bacterium]|jgi:alanine dehydrogenase
MIVGVPKEIKSQEGRVGIVPGGVRELASAGHTVLVEAGAGDGSGFGDDEFRRAGAEIVGSAGDLYGRSEMILKVKEPVEAEYPLLRPGQVIFCYLHLASNEQLTMALVERKVVGIAFETVATAEGRAGARPLLEPMSRIAGHLSVLKGAEFLQAPQGGRGVLLGGEAERDDAARVLVFGAGVAGSAAARAAAGLGARVTVVDIDRAKLEGLKSALDGKIDTFASEPDSVRRALAAADLVVGAVLSSGDRAPHVITRDMLGLMRAGSVIVDIAIDQGGCVETSRPTTHAEPVFEVEGVLHYCVTNMPGSVPATATRMLARVSIPYALQIADKGWRGALAGNAELARGLNVCEGAVTLEPVAKLFGLQHVPVERMLARE